MTKNIFSTLFALLLVTLPASAGNIRITKGNVEILIQNDEASPVRLAAETLVEDFQRTMGFSPALLTDAKGQGVSLVIINDQTSPSKARRYGTKALKGFESHEVIADEANNRILLHGADMRGTIFAIYTFSEQVLGVPPLWYFCDFNPELKDEILTDIQVRRSSPQVRYRAWFPNDTDLLTPWHRKSPEHEGRWFEAMLRLRLNCVELETTVTYPDYKLSSEAELVRRYGIVLTSHHHVALNNSFTKWDGYWREVRHQEPQPPALSREQDLIDFWTYNAETVHRSGIENLWQVTFRGAGDQPFWALFKDAPQSDAERGAVISRMMQLQLDIIKKVTGERDPYVRTTFYDEMSNLLAAGHIHPPVGKNMIWTYVAARRDHYPNDDMVQFDARQRVKLGYYLNMQFTSTGAHLAEAEGPWKMEQNYRYVNSRAPLYFSVVNAGNVREFLLSMSANAAMMWEFKQYDTDQWLRQYCAQYFGEGQAEEAAQIVHDYFYAYWQQRPSEFPGMDRQFTFQDMRYARAMDQILGRFRKYEDNPLRDIGYESVKGRSFRLTGDNQVDTLIAGMAATHQRFEAVSRRAINLEKRIPERQRQYFHDNIATPARYMACLSRGFYHFMLAYKGQADTTLMRANLAAAIYELEQARTALHSTYHGVWDGWYDPEYLLGLNGKINSMKRLMEETTAQ